MLKLQVLGTGCPKCKRLEAQTQAAAQATGIEYELVKVTNMDEIMAFGVMMTPALVINGEVKVVGKVPSVSEIQKLLM
jgi:small redox-active disulfide protein 2